ncbi:hypothetical protein ACFLZ7_04360 [Nanoarchaeota archaeon]
MPLFGIGKRQKEKEFEDLEKELGLPEEIGKVPEAKADETLKPDDIPTEPERPAFKEEPMEEPRLEPIHHEPPHQKDLELLSAKLDSIRLMIDGMNERIKHIERMEEEEVKNKRTW